MKSGEGQVARCASGRGEALSLIMPIPSERSPMNRLVYSTLLLPFMLAACSMSPTLNAPSANQADVPKLAPDEVERRRSDIMAMRDKTLDELFRQKPEAKAELEKAAGYAVFDSSQFNIVLFVGAQGRGVLVDNATQTPTFMLAARAGTGPGLGYKSFRQVMIFKNKKVLDQFRTVGADVMASANATAKLSDSDSTSAEFAKSFDPYIDLYEFTDKGLVLQANWGGAAYVPDSQLNQR